MRSEIRDRYAPSDVAGWSSSLNPGEGLLTARGHRSARQ
jgi:hypothetical protein